MVLAKSYTTHSPIICENSSATITCPQSSGQFINVTYANYGRLTSDFCSKNGVTNCRASISYSVVRSKCDALNSCTLTASNYVFTDPCVGTFKYLEVKYTCMDGELISILLFSLSSLELNGCVSIIDSTGKQVYLLHGHCYLTASNSVFH